MININIGRKHLLVFLIMVAIATVINYTLAQGGGTQSHPYTQIELPAGVWTGLNADMVDGQNATDLGGGGGELIICPSLGKTCTNACDQNTQCGGGSKTCAYGFQYGNCLDPSYASITCVTDIKACSSVSTKCACWP